MILYRYISLDRFFSSLKTVKGNHNFICRFNSPVNFEDKWEGLGNGLVNQIDAIIVSRNYEDRVESSGGTVSSKKASRKYINSLHGIKDDLSEQLVESIKYSNSHLMSCWFMGEENSPDSESNAMWNLYARHNGILIGYEENVIRDILKDLSFVFKGGDEVKYVDFLNSSFNSELHCNLRSLFLKDHSYAHEKEYRFIIEKNIDVNFTDVEFPLPKYLIANPSFSDETISKLNKVIKTYDNLTLKKSKLSTKYSRNDILEYLEKT